MLNNMNNYETIKLFLPLIFIQLCLMIFSLIVLKKSKVKYLPKWGWAIIIVIGELLGPIVFLLVGREKE